MKSWLIPLVAAALAAGVAVVVTRSGGVSPQPQRIADGTSAPGAPPAPAPPSSTSEAAVPILAHVSGLTMFPRMGVAYCNLRVERVPDGEKLTFEARNVSTLMDQRSSFLYDTIAVNIRSPNPDHRDDTGENAWGVWAQADPTPQDKSHYEGGPETFSIIVPDKILKQFGHSPFKVWIGNVNSAHTVWDITYTPGVNMSATEVASAFDESKWPMKTSAAADHK